MLEKLQIIKQRLDEVSDLIIQPDVITDQKRYVQLNKEYKDLRILMDRREQYLEFTNNIAEAEEIIADGSDAEMVGYGQNATRRRTRSHSETRRGNKSAFNS